MKEGDVVDNTAGTPGTVSSLAADLRALAVRRGSVLLVHGSLSSLGWVVGGPVAVVQALLEVLGNESTLVMPAYSGEYTDPSGWENPPVPKNWWPVIRESMPAYDPAVTPSRVVGAIAECFRNWPGSRRSDHPHASFCALGPRADEICEGHSIESSMGEGSPLRRIYDLDGHVLLLGVSWGQNSSFHLSEYRASFPEKRKLENGSPILRRGERIWTRYEDLDLWGGDFRRIGADFEGERSSPVRTGPVAGAPSMLFPQRAAVDFAVEWMECYRKGDWRVPRDK